MDCRKLSVQAVPVPHISSCSMQAVHELAAEALS